MSKESMDAQPTSACAFRGKEQSWSEMKKHVSHILCRDNGARHVSNDF